jgi:hypothetical protein
MPPTIYLAFRFHGSFYHSYRGDTPDELGFGKDIRIIRHLIETLDEFNARGIPVRGTWDFENYFSLEKIMPVYCPDLIAGLQRRVRDGQDEMQLMSYNNGLINAHTAREFEAAIRRGVTNANGSGLRDLFGDHFVGMVRPQEMMYTPIHLKMYKACGIDSISLYYSALPFNGFSNFVPPLTFMERYNPLTLTYPGIDETMTLLPCYNTGDLADHLTLRRWIKQMRRQQLALEKPQDVLLLIDMDADDEFWVGFDVPLLKGRFSTASGLKGLVENVADLDYLAFTTPGDYLKNHQPLRSITIEQDTADGSFDGFSSWAEKWSNQRLWTGLERARLLELQARRLLANELPAPLKSLLDESFEARLKILSTTHFGMAAPVMNLTREAIARDLVRDAVETAAAAFDRAAEKTDRAAFSLLDYVRGDSTELITYQARPSRSLVRLPLRESALEKFFIRDVHGRIVPSATLNTDARRELLFVESFEPNERKDYAIEVGEPAAVTAPVSVSDRSLRNEFLQIDFDQQGQLSGVQLDGSEFALDRFLRSGITYAGKSSEVETWTTNESLSLGVVGLKRMHGSLTLKGGYAVRFEREIMLAAGLPYLYATLRIYYPRTPDQGYDRGKAQRLQQAWDNDWQEITPCEIFPALAGHAENPLRVWKHNYCDHISSFSLDYGRFSKNIKLDSVNNHVTHGWVAVSDGDRGLLVAQTGDVASGMAFCPLRTRRQKDVARVRFNPFGTYWGKQYRYATADTGLGNLLATAFSASDHIKSYAPSYNGRVQEFSLMIAPYTGDVPPETVRYAAEAFAYPYLVLNDDRVIAVPPHRSWDGAGLGETPDQRND